MSNLKLPSHIAIIMDGNGRWAKKRFQPRIFGHKAGVEAFRGIVQYCGTIGISYLTLYAFSSENWTRPLEEVKLLMDLLRKYIENEEEFLQKNNVKIRFIGRRQGLAAEIVAGMNHLEAVTENNTGLTLILAINYGSHNEMIDAMTQLFSDMRDQESFDMKQEFEKRLLTHQIPAPDLLIRTAGERRISNFLLWQIAYSEFYFTDILWPDFDSAALDAAILDYQQRERRYGGLVE